jgi:hypothetical protein
MNVLHRWFIGINLSIFVCFVSVSIFLFKTLKFWIYHRNSTFIITWSLVVDSQSLLCVFHYGRSDNCFFSLRYVCFSSYCNKLSPIDLVTARNTLNIH